ncbi:MAG: hypothetical protein KME10_07930 [Plectolyngbya sp. WJT66-NPBG17]|jgi:hypothetical protein|nr:hypothetical protein [Plectolyngbya sp. WJT66-NPBG17]MBW4527799.1 hypothetical protein [Phormidium tanganyikae FI6-MK23]
MSKYKITIRVTGADYEEKISFFGFQTTRKGSTLEAVIEAPDAESAKKVIQDAVGKNLQLEAQKI